MAIVLKAVPLRPAWDSGRTGSLRSSDWIAVFSSTQNTAACAGGFTYSPIMSAALRSKSGSFEAMQRSSRCGFNPCFAHTRHHHLRDRQRRPACACSYVSTHRLACLSASNPEPARPISGQLAWALPRMATEPLREADPLILRSHGKL
jgi:hypothetical protein